MCAENRRVSVQAFKSPQRYLSVDLKACTEICPDWVLVFFELLRQQKIQGLVPGDTIGLRKPIWDSAGITSLDRRKKVMNHLERIIPRDVIEFERRKGVIPLAVIGPKMAEFHNRNSS